MRLSVQNTSKKKRSSIMVSARCKREQKDAYIELAEALGFDSLSRFVIGVLDGMTERYSSDSWECRLVHVNEDRIVAAEASDVGGVPLATAAYKVVAPKAFWDHIEQVTKTDCGDS